MPTIIILKPCSAARHWEGEGNALGVLGLPLKVAQARPEMLREMNGYLHRWMGLNIDINVLHSERP